MCPQYLPSYLGHQQAGVLETQVFLKNRLDGGDKVGPPGGFQPLRDLFLWGGRVDRTGEKMLQTCSE